MIYYQCSNCQRKLRAEEDRAETSARCPYCRHVGRIPAVSATPALAAVPGREVQGGNEEERDSIWRTHPRPPRRAPTGSATAARTATAGCGRRRRPAACRPVARRAGRPLRSPAGRRTGRPGPRRRGRARGALGADRRPRPLPLRALQPPPAGPRDLYRPVGSLSRCSHVSPIPAPVPSDPHATEPDTGPPRADDRVLDSILMPAPGPRPRRLRTAPDGLDFIRSPAPRCRPRWAPSPPPARPRGPARHPGFGRARAARGGQAGPGRLRFRVLRPHAEGGLGRVSVALDEELPREVALKEIKERHADDLGSRARFLLEAQLTGALEHPCIVPVYGLGTYADGRPYYAMRFIKGEQPARGHRPLPPGDGPGGARGERRLALRELLGRFIDVCNAIEYAHSRGVLHRDLKPGNVMLGKYGETLVVIGGWPSTSGARNAPPPVWRPRLTPGPPAAW